MTQQQTKKLLPANLELPNLKNMLPSVNTNLNSKQSLAPILKPTKPTKQTNVASIITNKGKTDMQLLSDLSESLKGTPVNIGILLIKEIADNITSNTDLTNIKDKIKQNLGNLDHCNDMESLIPGFLSIAFDKFFTPQDTKTKLKELANKSVQLPKKFIDQIYINLTNYDPVWLECALEQDIYTFLNNQLSDKFAKEGIPNGLISYIFNIKKDNATNLNDAYIKITGKQNSDNSDIGNLNSAVNNLKSSHTQDINYNLSVAKRDCLKKAESQRNSINSDIKLVSSDRYDNYLWNKKQEELENRINLKLTEIDLLMKDLQNPSELLESFYKLLSIREFVSNPTLENRKELYKTYLSSLSPYLQTIKQHSITQNATTQSLEEQQATQAIEAIKAIDEFEPAKKGTPLYELQSARIQEYLQKFTKPESLCFATLHHLNENKDKIANSGIKEKISNLCELLNSEDIDINGIKEIIEDRVISNLLYYDSEISDISTFDFDQFKEKSEKAELVIKQLEVLSKYNDLNDNLDDIKNDNLDDIKKDLVSLYSEHKDKTYFANEIRKLFDNSKKVNLAIQGLLQLSNNFLFNDYENKFLQDLQDITDINTNYNLIIRELEKDFLIPNQQYNENSIKKLLTVKEKDEISKPKDISKLKNIFSDSAYQQLVPDNIKWVKDYVKQTIENAVGHYITEPEIKQITASTADLIKHQYPSQRNFDITLKDLKSKFDDFKSGQNMDDELISDIVQTSKTLDTYLLKQDHLTERLLNELLIIKNDHIIKKQCNNLDSEKKELQKKLDNIETHIKSLQELESKINQRKFINNILCQIIEFIDKPDNNDTIFNELKNKVTTQKSQNNSKSTSSFTEDNAFQLIALRYIKNNNNIDIDALLKDIPKALCPQNLDYNTLQQSIQKGKDLQNLKNSIQDLLNKQSEHDTYNAHIKNKEMLTQYADIESLKNIYKKYNNIQPSVILKQADLNELPEIYITPSTLNIKDNGDLILLDTAIDVYEDLLEVYDIQNTPQANQGINAQALANQAINENAAIFNNALAAIENGHEAIYLFNKLNALNDAISENKQQSNAPDQNTDLVGPICEILGTSGTSEELIKQLKQAKGNVDAIFNTLTTQYNKSKLPGVKKRSPLSGFNTYTDLQNLCQEKKAKLKLILENFINQVPAAEQVGILKNLPNVVLSIPIQNLQAAPSEGVKALVNDIHPTNHQEISKTFVRSLIKEYGTRIPRNTIIQQSNQESVRNLVNTIKSKYLCSINSVINNYNNQLSTPTENTITSLKTIQETETDSSIKSKSLPEYIAYLINNQSSISGETKNTIQALFGIDKIINKTDSQKNYLLIQKLDKLRSQIVYQEYLQADQQVDKQAMAQAIESTASTYSIEGFGNINVQQDNLEVKKTEMLNKIQGTEQETAKKLLEDKIPEYQKSIKLKALQNLRKQINVKLNLVENNNLERLTDKQNQYEALKKQYHKDFTEEVRKLEEQLGSLNSKIEVLVPQYQASQGTLQDHWNSIHKKLLDKQDEQKKLTSEQKNTTEYILSKDICPKWNAFSMALENKYIIKSEDDLRELQTFIINATTQLILKQLPTNIKFDSVNLQHQLNRILDIDLKIRQSNKKSLKILKELYKTDALKYNATALPTSQTSHTTNTPIKKYEDSPEIMKALECRLITLLTPSECNKMLDNQRVVVSLLAYMQKIITARPVIFSQNVIEILSNLRSFYPKSQICRAFETLMSPPSQPKQQPTVSGSVIYTYFSKYNSSFLNWTKKINYDSQNYKALLGKIKNLNFTPNESEIIKEVLPRFFPLNWQSSLKPFWKSDKLTKFLEILKRKSLIDYVKDSSGITNHLGTFNSNYLAIIKNGGTKEDIRKYLANIYTFDRCVREPENKKLAEQKPKNPSTLTLRTSIVFSKKPEPPKKSWVSRLFSCFTKKTTNSR